MAMKEIMKNAGFAESGACRIEENLILCKRKMPDNAKSLICGIIPYYTELRGNISIYAMGKDYHIKAQNMLKSAEKALSEKYKGYYFKGFCDSSPVNEVLAAASCSLGVIGKNRLLINKTYGSFVFIAEIITDMEIDIKKNEPSFCIGCGKCLEVCPLSALKENSFDKEKCLSFITQKKGELSDREKQLIKKEGSVWGCDKCQLCCPYNENIKPADIEDPISFLDEKAVETSSQDRAYMWRGKETLLRNISIQK